MSKVSDQHAQRQENMGAGNKRGLLDIKGLACIFIILIAAVFSLGFSGGKNPLIGTWKCNSQETLDLLDRQMTDMEKDYYLAYYDSIDLNITEKEMILKYGQNREQNTYEVIEKSDSKVFVRYPEEDEKDQFEFLDDDTMRWSLETDKGKMDFILERQ